MSAWEEIRRIVDDNKSEQSLFEWWVCEVVSHVMIYGEYPCDRVDCLVCDPSQEVARKVRADD
jgi:hypothetical protein